MSNPAHQAHLEYLWGDKLGDYEKFIFLGGDAWQRELFGGGVYFLWNKEGLRYIGQSEWVWRRLSAGHTVVKNNLDAWVIGVIPVEERRERLYLEAWCIKAFNPPLNVVAIGPDPRRIKEVRRLRKEGKTLQSIGDMFGITRERVRQILAQE